jgi:hypothetical protein
VDPVSFAGVIEIGVFVCKVIETEQIEAEGERERDGKPDCDECVVHCAVGHADAEQRECGDPSKWAACSRECEQS